MKKILITGENYCVLCRHSLKGLYRPGKCPNCGNKYSGPLANKKFKAVANDFLSKGLGMVVFGEQFTLIKIPNKPNTPGDWELQHRLVNTETGVEVQTRWVIPELKITVMAYKSGPDLSDVQAATPPTEAEIADLDEYTEGK